MREITCDICKIKIGSKHEKIGVSFNMQDINYSGFFSKEERYTDICNNCEQELRDSIHKTLEKLKLK